MYIAKYVRRTEGFPLLIRSHWTTATKELEKTWTPWSELFPNNQSSKYRTLNQCQASFRATPHHAHTILSLCQLNKGLHCTSILVNVVFVVLVSKQICPANNSIHLQHQQSFTTGSTLQTTANCLFDTVDCTGITCCYIPATISICDKHLQPSSARSQDSNQGHQQQRLLFIACLDILQPTLLDTFDTSVLVTVAICLHSPSLCMANSAKPVEPSIIFSGSTYLQPSSQILHGLQHPPKYC